MGVLAHRKNTKVVSHPCGKTCWLSLSWQWEPTKGQLGRWVSDIHLLVFWQDLSLVRSLCVRGGFLVRRIQQERPLPGPNTQSRMKSLEAPRDEFLVVHLVRGCNFSHFPSSVLLSEASFLAWLAALLVTRLSHCWRYYLNSIPLTPLTPSHPKGPLRISRSSSLFTPAFSLCYLPSQKTLPLFQPRMCS